MIFTKKQTNKLAKTLSALALALAFSSAAQAAIIEYNYSNSDATNSITANFFIDDSKPTNNFVSGMFTLNGTKYTASSTKSIGFIDFSTNNNPSFTFTGYQYYLESEESGRYAFSIYNFVETRLSDGSTTPTASAGVFSLESMSINTNIRGAGTLSIVTPSIAAAVPEPESYAMMLAGLGLLGFTARRKKTSGLI